MYLDVWYRVGQVAHLNAKLYKTSRIYFIGTFLQHNVISQQRLAYSIDYWSQGKMEAQFLEHEVNICIIFLVLHRQQSGFSETILCFVFQGYFGALGAFLLNGGIEHDDNALPVESSKMKILSNKSGQ